MRTMLRGAFGVSVAERQGYIVDAPDTDGVAHGNGIHFQDDQLEDFCQPARESDADSRGAGAEYDRQPIRVAEGVCGSGKRVGDADSISIVGQEVA